MTGESGQKPDELCACRGIVGDYAHTAPAGIAAVTVTVTANVERTRTRTRTRTRPARPVP